VNFLLQNHAVSRNVASGDISFFLINYALSVSAAQTACAQRGSGWNLATIESAAENTAVTPLITASTWIGLNDLTTQGVWAWSTGSPALYRNWNTNEPNLIGSERYVEIGTDGKWNNVGTSSNKRALCSVRIVLPDCSRSFKARRCCYIIPPFQSVRALYFFNAVGKTTRIDSCFSRLLLNSMCTRLK
jgi:hypothetical protein